MTRIADLIFSLLFILLFSPFFILLALWIRLDSKGPVIYKQKRVGRYGKDFMLYKFRSMRVGADKDSLLTLSETDSRITKPGTFIRRYKLDELPQLINVLKGDMSLVGPRPEVRKYVDLYTEQQKAVLNIRPGITDIASIIYSNESSILEAQKEPERYYIEQILPDKIRLNMVYISDPSFGNYCRILWKTVKVLLR